MVFETKSLRTAHTRCIAVVYLGLGKSELAMDWLENSYADRSNGLVFMKVEPELDPLRSNPRFLALRFKLNFPND